MTRLFSLGNSRETVLFGGLEPDRNLLSEPLKVPMPKEQPTISATIDLAPIRLRVWFSLSGLYLIEDIKRKGLKDMVFDAIALQDLSDQYQAQVGYNNINNAFLVDLAVLETSISRVLGKYRLLKFVPLSNDNPIIV
ncbi:uncharacterized protein N7500_008552 [Penicillium coprophilum]|uniref:uncharacterized protein n=1 Tax=Penicillium coprophilum TaxID=36646 RepID=UPI0023A0F3A2|nr:uncharacterized protein N7500_008552 [Penicillium coprophilum]KAJ5158901.1 hypothetical protein N7500_008552 [Penicillium coprophilum]